MSLHVNPSLYIILECYIHYLAKLKEVMLGSNTFQNVFYIQPWAQYHQAIQLWQNL
jgi:hypothetical protein